MKIALLLLILLGCTTQKKTEKPIIPLPFEVKVEDPKPIINEEAQVETVLKPMVRQIKKLPVGIIFGPGLNRTVGYSTFLKAVKKQKIEIEMVSGMGMGAVFAAHVAAGKTPQKMEWLFFKFFNETKEKMPFSKSWRKALEEIFLEEFRNVKIEQLKIPLLIPVFQKNPPGVKIINRGNLYELLVAQFEKNENEEGPYLTPLGKDIQIGSWMRSMGAEIVVGIDVLGRRQFFEAENLELEKFYLIVARTFKREKKKFDLFFSLPFSDMPLDSERKLPESLQKTAEFSQFAAKAIRAKKNKAIANEKD